MSGFTDLFKKGYKYCGKVLSCINVESGLSIEKIFSNINDTICECCDKGLKYKIDFKGYTKAAEPDILDPNGLPSYNVSTNLSFTAPSAGTYHFVLQANFYIDGINSETLGFALGNTMIKDNNPEIRCNFIPENPPGTPREIMFPITVREDGIVLQAGDVVKFWTSTGLLSGNNGTFAVYKD